MRIALHQMNSIDRSIAENTALFDQACATAKTGGADLIIFPEMALTGYNIGAERIRTLAEPCSGAMVQALRDMAQRHNIGLLCGFPELDGTQVFNSAALIDASGRLLSVCRKAHLFGDVDRAAFSAADALCPIAQFGDWSLGLAICYDVEFPELVALIRPGRRGRRSCPYGQHATLHRCRHSRCSRPRRRKRNLCRLCQSRRQ